VVPPKSANPFAGLKKKGGKFPPKKKRGKAKAPGTPGVPMPGAVPGMPPQMGGGMPPMMGGGRAGKPKAKKRY
jgi:hypothetical protein